MIKATLKSVPTLVAERREFNCNNTLFALSIPLTVDVTAAGGRHYGMLPNEYMDDFRIACAATDFYGVYSYRTPIAWYANGTWTIPPVKYSHTTSRHQGRLYLVVRQVLNEAGIPA